MNGLTDGKDGGRDERKEDGQMHVWMDAFFILKHEKI